MWKEILAVLLGWTALCLVLTYAQNSAAEQKIENIDKLYRLKTNLENVKSIQKTDSLIQDTERLIDSMNNIK